MAFAAGMLHDYGKYQQCFQARLIDKKTRCPHAIYGAIALRQFDSLARRQDRSWMLPAVCAVAAHHAGLKDWHEHRSDTAPPSDGEVESNVAAEYRRTAEDLLTSALADQPMLRTVLAITEPGPAGGTRDMQTRMLLSCLVDADRLNTAGQRPVQASLRPAERLTQMAAHLNKLAAAANHGGTATAVRDARDEVQRMCAEAAKKAPGLFSLCVPTGGGKTLAAMRFALEHAAARPDELRRVIVVIPYLSIIEQNAKVYADVFGADAVLEHHSGAVYSVDKVGSPVWSEGEDETAAASTRSVETENWDAPVIVTTSVRFFESLFSNHPSDLRRIHNIARSVIVLDEVQTLPRRLLAPLLDMLRELTEDWGCTVVLSTATQPAFEASGKRQNYLWPAGIVTPIVPPATAERMARMLQRVRIQWELDKPVTWPDLAERMAEHSQVLCVVNLRDHATALYDALRGRDLDGLFHLSTRMCAQHRLRTLEAIRQRLRSGLPCRIVSTQLVEAGVDLDVPIAFRALGPLDSIIQVAGRVDREGRATAQAGQPAGTLVVFMPEEDRWPGADYKDAAGVTQGVLNEFDQLDTSDLDAVREFFRRYYSIAGENRRGEDLAALRLGAAPQFRSLADAFELIDSRAVSVFVPYEDGAALLNELAQAHTLDRGLLRRLQRYTVSLQPHEFEDAKTRGLYEIWSGSDLWACNAAQYSSEKGMLPTMPASGFVM